MFDHYEPPPDWPRLQGELFDLIASTLARHLPAERAEVLQGELAAHLAAYGESVYNHVSPARTDVEPEYDRRLEATLERSRHVGAVHLELGTWTAFPDNRTEELREEEGLAEFVRLDFEPAYRPDVAADVTQLPFADGSLDRVVSNSVLEHVAHPHAVIRESFRVLRPGGVMVCVTPFVFNLHGYPDDYLRYTPAFYERISREVGFADCVSDVSAASGLYYTLHSSSKAAIVDATAAEAEAMRALHLTTMNLLAALVPFDRYFTGRAQHWFHSTRFFAIKPGAYEPSRRSRGPGAAFVDRALDLLRCPRTGRPLRRHGDSLVAWPHDLRYRIVDAVPVLISPEPGPLRRQLKKAARRVPLVRERIRP